MPSDTTYSICGEVATYCCIFILSFGSVEFDLLSTGKPVVAGCGKVISGHASNPGLALFKR